MTTNFEWLCENDRDMLLIMMTGECARCKFDGECAVGIELKCSSSEWLNSEYVEPDSWEKIEKDARLGLDDYYFDILCMGMRHVATAADMHRYVIEDIINRCKALAGAE